MAQESRREPGWPFASTAGFVVGWGTGLLAILLMPRLFQSQLPKAEQCSPPSTVAAAAAAAVTATIANTPPKSVDIKVSCVSPTPAPASCPACPVCKAPAPAPAPQSKPESAKVYPPPPVKFIP